MSVQAMEWARRQVVGDALAKSLLRAIADYADEHGRCWPSLGRLASDCEISEDTVRRKIKLLEDGDCLVRIRAFRDEQGHRNTEGRGRETTSEIRLRIQRMGAPDPSIPVIETDAAREGLQPARVAGCEGSSDTTPGVALVPPPNEPSLKEVSPQKPPCGTEAGQPSKEAIEGLGRFKATHPRPSQHPERLESLWLSLTDAERARAQRGAEGVVAYCKGQAKLIASVLAADKFLATPALWDDMARYAPPEPGPAPERQTLPTSSLEYGAVLVCCAIAGRRPPRVANGAFEFVGDVPAGAAAMAALEDRPGALADVTAGKVPDGWNVVFKGTPLFAAWRTRVKEWLGVEPEPRRYWLDAQACIVESADKAEQLPSGIANSRDGLAVPVTETGFPPPKGARTEGTE